MATEDNQWYFDPSTGAVSQGKESGWENRMGLMRLRPKRAPHSTLLRHATSQLTTRMTKTMTGARPVVGEVTSHFGKPAQSLSHPGISNPYRASKGLLLVLVVRKVTFQSASSVA